MIARARSARRESRRWCDSVKRVLLVFTLVAAPVVASVVRAQEDAPDHAAVVLFTQWFEQVSNHGRWGADDERGTLNLITPERTREAAESVRAGVAISLSRELKPGADLNAIAPLEVEYTGAGGGGQASFFSDRTTIIYHGWAYSHLDALAHLASNGAFYNGFPESLAVQAGGSSRLGIENVGNGIVTRGVLIDVPWLKDVPYLEPSTPVTLEDLAAWEDRTGVRIQDGDVVLIRTGRGARETQFGAWSVQEGAAGPHPEIAGLLHARGVAVLGGDVNNEIYPSVIPGNGEPMHLLAIVSMGMPLFDNLGLEAVAREARERERWTFLFMAAPLPIQHATGSAVNPLAIF